MVQGTTPAPTSQTGKPFERNYRLHKFSDYFIKSKTFRIACVAISGVTRT